MQKRLQKIIAQAGIASRRTAETLIREGHVWLNGRIVTQLGTKADPDIDEIRVDGKRIAPEPRNIYIMLHKPRGYITTLRDPEGRPIVTELVSSISERIFPVGRLDYDSEGLLLLTNDGAFSQRVLHPSFAVPRSYRVKIAGHITDEQWRALANGLDLADGPFQPVSISLEKSNKKSSWLNVILVQGRTREIRRAFHTLGHRVSRLIRIGYGNLELGTLPIEKWRYLTNDEVRNLLKMSRG
jgi:23S rRNA pseudouridine2605 synthase